MSNNKSEVFFDKTVFGGYDPEQVDEFVNEARKLLTGFKKENQVLKQKLQVLAEALEEARNVADSSVESPQPATLTEPDVQCTEEQNAVVPTEDLISETAEQIEELNLQLADLFEQIQLEQNHLSELRKEHAAFIASLTEQYELQLRELGEAAHASLHTDSVPSDETEEMQTAQPVEADPTVQDATLEHTTPQVPQEKEDAASVKDAAPSHERNISQIENTVSVQEPVQMQNVPQDTEASVQTTVPVVQPVPSIEDSASDQETEPASVQPVQPIETTSPEQHTEPIHEPNAQPTVDAGESVYLNAQGVDTTNLSYEEALALVLKKNGILSHAPDNSSEELSDNQATKIIPRIPSIQTSASEKPEKVKKNGFFKSLKNSIRAFLDEDEEGEDLAPSSNQIGHEELQFGKAYNVKNDR